MLILRNREDIPQKIEELKVIYPSKKIADIKIDEAIQYLSQVRDYRGYTDTTDMFYHQIVLHNMLKKYLKSEPEWEKREEGRLSILDKINRVNRAITEFQIKVIKKIGEVIAKVYSDSKNKAVKKREDLKKKGFL